MKKSNSRGSGHNDDDGDVDILSPNICLLGDELIECEILSRLPVKSLKRFRCVCKHWRSLFDQDKQFHDLHLTRSKTRPRLLFFGSHPGSEEIDDMCLLSAHMEDSMRLLSAHMEDGAIVVDREKTISPEYWWEDQIGMMSVNSLICFVYERGFLIYNVSTGETTPFIKISIEEDHQDDMIIEEVHYSMDRCGFGYDPTTKEHKVICTFLRCKTRTGCDTICVVLTVGVDNVWRKIEYPFPQYYLYGESAYVNGVTYWLHSPSRTEDSAIVAFDVGPETFRVIPIPKFILDPTGTSNMLFDINYNLFEVDGRIALLDGRGTRGNGNIIKMWMFDDDYNKEKSTNTSNNWTAETILMPSLIIPPIADWEQVRRCHTFRAIAGTDLITAVETFVSRDPLTVYFYDRNKKTSKRIEVTCTILKDKPHIGVVMSLLESLSTVVALKYVHKSPPPLVNYYKSPPPPSPVVAPNLIYNYPPPLSPAVAPKYEYKFLPPPSPSPPPPPYYYYKSPPTPSPVVAPKLMYNYPPAPSHAVPPKYEYKFLPPPSPSPPPPYYYYESPPIPSPIVAPKLIYNYPPPPSPAVAPKYEYKAAPLPSPSPPPPPYYYHKSSPTPSPVVAPKPIYNYPPPPSPAIAPKYEYKAAPLPSPSPPPPPYYYHKSPPTPSPVVASKPIYNYPPPPSPAVAPKYEYKAAPLPSPSAPPPPYYYYKSPPTPAPVIAPKYIYESPQPPTPPPPPNHSHPHLHRQLHLNMNTSLFPVQKQQQQQQHQHQQNQHQEQHQQKPC